jgi:hypothetical protein
LRVGSDTTVFDDHIPRIGEIFPAVFRCKADMPSCPAKIKSKIEWFDYSKSGGRIDALVALSMALAVVNKARPVEFDVEALIG